VATSERLGFRAEAVASKADEPFDLGILEAEPQLVVLVVGTEQAGQVAAWKESTWCVPSRLTAGFASLGIDVLTVSAGAGAGALIGCYEQGATILFDLDELPAELALRRRHVGSHRPSGADPNGARLPQRFEALLQLTASERRVLFYLTTGLSAQEIADIQVVSLTTVRSHIRSILRKLGVRSQLAAVVCANSRDLGRIQPQVGTGDRAPTSRRSSA
jgi:DNA-binding CsgD family transcriptional regulator